MSIIYIVSFCVSAACAVSFLLLNGKKSKLLCALLKAAASLALAAPAYRAFAVSKNIAFLLIALAITVCACADLVIHFKFIPGGILFAFAHCLFAPAFIIYGSKLYVAVIAFVLYAIACAFAFSYFELPAQTRFPLTVYAAILGVMASFAIGGAFYGEAFGITSAVSALLFLASDVMLAMTVENKRPAYWDVLVMILYYMALAGFSLACRYFI